MSLGIGMRLSRCGSVRSFLQHSPRLPDDPDQITHDHGLDEGSSAN
jgi:hypothetical protein